MLSIVIPCFNENGSLARYEPDGTLDGTFGRRGRVWDGFPSGFEARAVAIDSRDRIVVVGGR